MKIIMMSLLLLFIATLHAEELQLEPLLEHLHEIATAHTLNPSEPIRIVAIGGCPGVGKTHLSQLLAK